MKLWKLTQSKLTLSNTTGFYDSAVVAAETEEAARGTHPGMLCPAWTEQGWGFRDPGGYVAEGILTDWPSPSDVTVTYLGEAAPGTEAGVICASYIPE